MEIKVEAGIKLSTDKADKIVASRRRSKHTADKGGQTDNSPLTPFCHINL